MVNLCTRPASTALLLLLSLQMLVESPSGAAAERKHVAHSKSRNLQKKVDALMQETRRDCRRRIEMEHNTRCKLSNIAFDNCAMRCISTTCYDRFFAGDPLEDGEKGDRVPKYYDCVRKQPHIKHEAQMRMG